MTSQPRPILIVEDIPYIREMLETALRLKGYSVRTAGDGEQALAMIAEQIPGLILTDILMPKLDGFAFAFQVRANPKTQDIPLIFISATYIDEQDKQFALSLGAVKFLKKPIETEELLLSVAEVLSNRTLQKRAPITSQEFYRGYRARLESKRQVKLDQVERARRLVNTVPIEQKPMFESLLTQTKVQLADIETELQLLEDQIKAEGS
jgi:CheY-like chemotaxis protein